MPALALDLEELRQVVARLPDLGVPLLRLQLVHFRALEYVAGSNTPGLLRTHIFDHGRALADFRWHCRRLCGPLH